MNINVQVFIEQQIDLIESSSWLELFSLWYNHYAPTDHNIDTVMLREFFDVIQQGGCGDIEKESFDARKSLIIAAMIQYIEELKFFGEPVVRMVGAVNSLRSRLSFGLLELKELFQEACEQQGLERTSDISLVFKLN